MDIVLQSDSTDYLIRPRINALLTQAVKKPMVIICAGGGYGKTRAVYDFALERKIPVAWMQLSDRDNVCTRFWENYVRALAKINKSLAEDLSEIGFPDTDGKLNQCLRLHEREMSNRQYMVVLDDLHNLKNIAVIRFIERVMYYMPTNRTMIMICRELPQINLVRLQDKHLVFSIYEENLNFTESELSQYLSLQGLSVNSRSLHEILQDTNGWAFAVNLIARSLRKSPGYSGYVRSAMRNNIFQLMEAEVFNVVSKRLRRFFVRLSLVDHLSADLVASLAGEDKGLLGELRQQTAFVRYDGNINAYLIHQLFLDFLRGKQEILTEEEKRETYRIAAAWCNQNGFKIDALTYYENIGDYESIISIFFDIPTQVPHDVALYASKIFERAPAEAFDSVNYLAVMHVRVVMCLGRWQEALELMAYYEARFLPLPENDTFRNHNLGSIYYCWGIMRSLMCTTNDCYDFHLYFAKQYECLTRSPIEPGQLANHPVGPWINLAGSARQGAPQKYIEASIRGMEYTTRCLNGCMAGKGDLAMGELLFYQGDVRAAEPLFVRGIARAQESRQFELTHRGLFYLMRIAFSLGDSAKAKRALKDMEKQLDENDYSIRFTTYDIALGWYYCALCQPERIPSWLKEKFAPYGHAYFIENFANQVKARYCYLTKNYSPLLTYMEEQKRRESILYGRVEMLLMESCIHLKTKNRTAAFAALAEAYENASPNDILMPFLELGKDMRTLVASALREPGFAIPRSWLETVGRKSATYAKYQGVLISDYEKAHSVDGEVALSSRENEVLRDMYHGLSRSEIAANRNLSINTVKLYINNIYDKLNACNMADVIRIAAERKLV